jgi:hypothetical protein
MMNDEKWKVLQNFRLTVYESSPPRLVAQHHQIRAPQKLTASSTGVIVRRG